MKQSIYYSSIITPTKSNHYNFKQIIQMHFQITKREQDYLSQSFQGSDSYEVANSQICS